MGQDVVGQVGCGLGHASGVARGVDAAVFAWRIPLKQGGIDRLLRHSEVILDQAGQVTKRVNQLLSQQDAQAINTAVMQLAEAASCINRVAK